MIADAPGLVLAFVLKASFVAVPSWINVSVLMSVSVLVHASELCYVLVSVCDAESEMCEVHVHIHTQLVVGKPVFWLSICLRRLMVLTAERVVAVS